MNLLSEIGNYRNNTSCNIVINLFIKMNILYLNFFFVNKVVQHNNWDEKYHFDEQNMKK